MKVLHTYRLYLFLLLLWDVPAVHAQVSDGPYLSWEEFVESVAELTNEDGEAVEFSQQQMEELENLALHPLQINRASREELLRLPFLNEAQVDSLLSYRIAKRGFVSLGELQLIKDFDYYSRTYLSLFLRADSAMIPLPEWQARWKEQERLTTHFKAGSYELENRMDFPLYKREGYKKTAENHYWGSAWRHVMRFRYHYRRQLSYGVTMEKDSGEPIAKQGYYPYDHLSAYFLMRPRGRNWSFVVGDYDLSGESGLLLGRPIFSGRSEILQSGQHRPYDFRAHSSSDECRFFRGAAAAYVHKGWRLMGFVSFRKLDAAMNERGDTALTLQTTGLHRTALEIEKRRRLNQLTSGLSAAWACQRWGLSFQTVYTHFGLPLWPPLRTYNMGYFRGQNAMAYSLGYFYRPFSKLALQGEVAADHRFRLATTHFVRFRPHRSLRAHLQLRYFAPDFVSLHGRALQQGSRVANEWGVLIGLRYLPTQELEYLGYLDFFRFPKPTYTTALPGAMGTELSLQASYKYSENWSFLARYRLKSRHYTVTGHKILEMRHLNRFRLVARYNTERWSIQPQADLTITYRQTGKHSLGWMLSLRTAWQPMRSLRIKSFLGGFMTDDYESAVYAYTPRLLRMMSFDRFYYHGVSCVLQADWAIQTKLHVGLRASTIYYLNRSSQSSGLNLIRSPWKNDLSVQLRYQFP